jgi:hypothetical protein
MRKAAAPVTQGLNSHHTTSKKWTSLPQAALYRTFNRQVYHIVDVV